jgi:hypothetical protein
MNMEPAQLVSAVGPQPLKYRTQRHRKGQLLPLHEPNSNPTGFLVFFRNDMSKTFRHFLLFSGLMHCAVLVAGRTSSSTCFKIFTSRIGNMESEFAREVSLS